MYEERRVDVASYVCRIMDQMPSSPSSPMYVDWPAGTPGDPWRPMEKTDQRQTDTQTDTKPKLVKNTWPRVTVLKRQQRQQKQQKQTPRMAAAAPPCPVGLMVFISATLLYNINTHTSLLTSCLFSLPLSVSIYLSLFLPLSTSPLRHLSHTDMLKSIIVTEWIYYGLGSSRCETSSRMWKQYSVFFFLLRKKEHLEFYLYTNFLWNIWFGQEDFDPHTGIMLFLFCDLSQLFRVCVIKSIVFCIYNETLLPTVYRRVK